MVGWSPEDGVERLAIRIPEVVPCGTTAKLTAVEAGEVPPGADADAVARAIIRDLRADPVRSPAWSCWVSAALMASLLEDADLGPVRVAAVRRIGDGAAIVDLHAAVVASDSTAADRWFVTDPHFGLAVRMPTPDEPATTAELPLGLAAARLEDDGRLRFDVHLGRWAAPLRYRLLAPDLDRDDVRAICAISVQHSGVAARPMIRLHQPDAIVEVRTDEEGVGLVDHWAPTADGTGTRTITTHATWDDAVADFADRTGCWVI